MHSDFCQIMMALLGILVLYPLVKVICNFKEMIECHVKNLYENHIAVPSFLCSVSTVELSVEANYLPKIDLKNQTYAPVD